MRSPWPRYERRSSFIRLAFAVALPLQALLICEWFARPLGSMFEAPFIVSTALVSWLCGPAYAAAAALGSALLLDYFFLPPFYSFALFDAPGLPQLAVFLGTNGIIIALVANLNRARAALEASEEVSRSLAELIPFGSWTADERGNMLRVSESFLKTLGATLDECRGHGWMQFIDPAQRDQVEEDWNECMRKSGYFWDAEYRMRAKNGKFYYVLSRGVPIREAGGSIRSWVGIHLDVTEMQFSIEERVMQARDLARFNAELEQFAYVSAHDLQEPLRMIASYLQLLQRRYGDRLDGDAHTFMNYAVEGAARLRALLQDLLVLQQIGKCGRPRTDIPLRTIVDRAVESLGPAARGATITCGELPVLHCDEHEFVQLFENLIGNAIKYSREGIAPEIRINAESRDDVWIISVRDNGIGIAEQYRYRIFDVFQRLHSRARYPGTGIGLAIVKKIVEVHGGSIWVESEPGAGSTFKFTTPRRVQSDLTLLPSPAPEYDQAH